MNTQYLRTNATLLVPVLAIVLGSAASTRAATSPTPNESKTKPVAATSAAAPATSTSKTAPAPAPAKAAAPVAAPTAAESDADDDSSKQSAPSGIETANATPVRLEEVEISQNRVSALTAAPTDSNLDTYQPESVVNIPFIANYLAPTADYSTIANIAPSVANVVTNGPGLSDARRATVRGFTDTQYNVTYDGIPFADTNDFSHHTTSYFPAKMIGRVVVDRGPGTASGIGEATFGGTIALYSKDPRTDEAIIPTISYGSYNTYLAHIEANTGLIRSLNQASGIASYQYMRTDGYQTEVKMTRDTTYIKYLQPIGNNTTLTFLSNYNSIKFNNPLPISQTQIDTLGRNFGLSGDPKNILYWGYNNRRNKTDFEYIGIDSAVTPTLHLVDKAYTFYYNNGSYDTTSIGTKAWDKGDIVGRYKLSAYRAWGDTLNIAWDNSFGTLSFGTWFDYERSPRYQYGLDYTKGKVLDYNPTANVTTAYFYNMLNYLYTNQSFVQYDWRFSKQLTINTGVKEVYFKRKIDASINQTTKTPLDYTKANSKPLGYLSANYSLQNEWTAYAQLAQGYLAPNLNQFYVPDPTKNQAKAQETVNYQVGTVYKKDRFNADADLYYIDYKNFPHFTNDLTTGQSILVMAKGAYFSGIETEATYQLDGGFSIYGNGSINQARYKKSKLDVDQVARQTAALGLLYDHNGIFGSFLAKYVGHSTVYFSSLSTGFNPDVRSSATATGTSGGYMISDVALGYGFKTGLKVPRSVKVRLEVNNVFDRKVQVLDSFSSAGVKLFDVLPTRNYFLTISAEF